MRKKRLISITLSVIFLILFIFILIIQLSKTNDKPLAKSGKSISIPASGLFTVKKTVMPVLYNTTGTVQSRNEVDLSSRIISRVTAINVRSGDSVKKGDILVRLDNRDLTAIANQAENKIKAIQSTINSEESNIKASKSAYNFAKSEKDRSEELYRKNVISELKWETDLAKYEQNKAKLNQSFAALNKIKAEYEAAMENYSKAKTYLTFSDIKSPMNGVVVERFLDPGDMATPGKTILRIFDPDKLMLEAAVRESLISKVKVGDKIIFYVKALNKTFTGDIKEIVPSVDPKTRTFIVKVCIGKEKGLVTGMFGTVSIKIGEKTVLLIPKKAIEKIGQVETVKILTTNNKIKKVFIRTKPSDNKKNMILLSGLKDGDKVIN